MILSYLLDSLMHANSRTTSQCLLMPADTDSAHQCIQLWGMRGSWEAKYCTARREKACCAWRTIPAFEPHWPCLGPHIANGRSWNVASNRRGKRASIREESHGLYIEPYMGFEFTRLYIEYRNACSTVWIWQWPNSKHYSEGREDSAWHQ